MDGMNVEFLRLRKKKSLDENGRVFFLPYGRMLGISC